MEKVYVLTEEIEFSSGAREFQVLGVYREEHVAQQAMRELIKEDEHDIINKLGVYYEDDYSFETNWDWAGLKYDISWHDIIR